MSISVTVRDETTAGVVVHSLDIQLPAETVSVEELIRSRVYQEVRELNARKSGAVHHGLVRPTEAEVVANGFRVRKTKPIQWKPQFEKACEAFRNRQVLIVVDDRQVETLDQMIEIASGTEISFIKLVLLVGG